MKVKNNKIYLTDKENEVFVKQFKRSIFIQLHKENLLTTEQLNQALKS